MKGTEAGVEDVGCSWEKQKFHSVFRAKNIVTSK